MQQGKPPSSEPWGIVPPSAHDSVQDGGGMLRSFPAVPESSHLHLVLCNPDLSNK